MPTSPLSHLSLLVWFLHNLRDMLTCLIWGLKLLFFHKHHRLCHLTTQLLANGHGCSHILQTTQDYRMRQLLLRCDRNGDLYPVTYPSSSTPFALLSFSHSTWHKRLGHLSDNANKLRFLVLQFVSRVEPAFDIIHSDLWTSRIPSVSGIKYYAIFLDHFSHYLWVYPLHHKSDLFAKF
ncbi:ribonuclease H-like domain-containing protein [Tanacetum coccineum]